MWGFLKAAGSAIWKGVRSETFRTKVLPVVARFVAAKVQEKRDAE